MLNAPGPGTCHQPRCQPMNTFQILQDTVDFLQCKNHRQALFAFSANNAMDFVQRLLEHVFVQTSRKNFGKALFITTLRKPRSLSENRSRSEVKPF